MKKTWQPQFMGAVMKQYSCAVYTTADHNAYQQLRYIF